VYIDPPYNTDEDGFIYKDQYKSSTWLSCLASLIKINMRLVSDEGYFAATIGEDEFKNFNYILLQDFSAKNYIGNLIWQKRKGGGNDSHFVAMDHDYIPIFVKNRESHPLKWRIPYDEKYLKRYKEKDNQGKFYWDTLSRPGLNNPIIFDVECPDGSIIKDGNWQISEKEFLLLKKNGDIRIEKDKNSNWMVHHKIRMPEGRVLRSIIDSYTNNDAANEMSFLFSDKKVFSKPKPSGLIKTIISLNIIKSSLILDYFAGSGTTAHAVINLNREDNGKRKYILMEQGEYFDTVLKPRIQKVVYANDWKEGKPKNHTTGISHAFKVLKIESYEDTLNNLELRRTEEQLRLLENRAELKDEYLMHYMLEIESRGSLLSVADFSKPFDYSLKVSTDSAGAYEMKKVDLIETFNYLIGLRVDSIDIDRKRGFALVKGYLPGGEDTLVIWRDTELVSYDELELVCSKKSINLKDSEFKVVYINGDHTIPSIFVSDDSEGGIEKRLKVRQIEPEFLSLMFQVEDIS
jgi:adenine-specific DNA-methyltransferase